MKLCVLASIIGTAAAGPGSNGLVNPCIDASSTYAKLPWCNAALPIDARVKDMVARMSIAEKIPNLNTGGTPIPSLGLPAYNWWEEASSGVSNGHETTKFAYPITTGMSFNRTLWKLTGRQIGHEARALMNAGQAGSTFWAPVINLAREPRYAIDSVVFLPAAPSHALTATAPPLSLSLSFFSLSPSLSAGVAT